LDTIGNEQYALGRLEQFDDRSRAFPIRTLVEGRFPRSYTWSVNTWLDQKREGSCVGFSWEQELAARPARVENVTNDTGTSIYKTAQKLDEWPGEAYSGTSVLAGVKAIQQLYPGAITEYRWAFGIDDLILAIGHQGPAVIGIKWYSGMYTPDANGFIKPKGNLVGGHAILVHGVNKFNKFFKLHNSWGKNWGKNGGCRLCFEDMEKLLNDGGEACIPVRRSVVSV